MKKLMSWLVFCAVISITPVSFGDDGQTMTVNKADLEKIAPGAFDKISKVQEVSTTLKQCNEWAGMGKEIGIAVNEGLTAVTEQTAKFADTTPGKWTMFIITYKVIGKDLMGVVLGVPILITWICLFIWCMKKMFFPHSILESVNADGKKNYVKVNDGCENMTENTLVALVISVIVFILVGILICGAVIF